MPEERAPWGAAGRERLPKVSTVSARKGMGLFSLFNRSVNVISLSVEIKEQRTSQIKLCSN